MSASSRDASIGQVRAGEARATGTSGNEAGYLWFHVAGFNRLAFCYTEYCERLHETFHGKVAWNMAA